VQEAPAAFLDFHLHVLYDVKNFSINGRGEMAKLNPQNADASPDSLRIPSLVALLVSAGGSVGFLLHAAGRNQSQVLIVLMAIWVLSPFIALASANLVAKHWPVPVRRSLYRLILVLAPVSLAVYGIDAVRQLNAKAAFVFVIVPPATCLVAATVLLAGWFRYRRLLQESRRER